MLGRCRALGCIGGALGGTPQVCSPRAGRVSFSLATPSKEGKTQPVHSKRASAPVTPAEEASDPTLRRTTACGSATQVSACRRLRGEVALWPKGADTSAAQPWWLCPGANCSTAPLVLGPPRHQRCPPTDAWADGADNSHKLPYERELLI